MFTKKRISHFPVFVLWNSPSRRTHDDFLCVSYSDRHPCVGPYSVPFIQFFRFVSIHRNINMASTTTTTTALIRTIRLLHTTVQGTRRSPSSVVRNGEQPIEHALRNVVFHPKYFPTFLGFTCVVSGVAGFQFMEYLKCEVSAMNRALKSNDYDA